MHKNNTDKRYNVLGGITSKIRFLVLFVRHRTQCPRWCSYWETSITVWVSQSDNKFLLKACTTFFSDD